MTLAPDDALSHLLEVEPLQTVDSKGFAEGENTFRDLCMSYIGD